MLVVGITSTYMKSVTFCPHRLPDALRSLKLVGFVCSLTPIFLEECSLLSVYSVQNRGKSFWTQRRIMLQALSCLGLGVNVCDIIRRWSRISCAEAPAFDCERALRRVMKKKCFFSVVVLQLITSRDDQVRYLLSYVRGIFSVVVL